MILVPTTYEISNNIGTVCREIKIKNRNDIIISISFQFIKI